MKKLILFIPALFSFHFTKAVVINSNQQQFLSDTTFVDEKNEDNQSHKNLSSPKNRSKENGPYDNQETLYPIKHLFINNTYNPLQPYAVQVNSNAAGFIQEYVRIHSNYLTQMKGWGRPYFNLIESLLQQYGLPKELKYIAVIESNLKSGVVSVKGACGPWQFMPETARQMGLTINAYTDERTDYFKSTHAAAKYLLQLYSQLHDWLLVMAAYNGGAGRVLNAIQRSGSRNFWDLQYYLPEESRTYVKRFIATHFIMEGNSGSNGEWAIGNNKIPVSFSNTTGYNPSNDEVSGILVQPISGKFNSLVIAKNLSMDIQEFNGLNPDFDNTLHSELSNYDLRLPEEKMQLFKTYKTQILTECVQVILTDDTVINPLIYAKPPHDKYSSKRTPRKKSRV